ncbi:HupE/UreJ family protein [Uliginosibacterium sp. 31-16]|uniref:HupE/UreJ family protein n=1 Tax=Uliginosibacterium sp. 31-16 TaxID=3068315 RepID=UPI00273F8667|nr:HupE/UreJ family protein [Uliginosibacterium sp. 31-16]MDP5237995.1 HupE/UreJ family protein [Uliginosibacterium sp. 31-16]
MKRILIALCALLPALAFAHIGADAGIHHGSAFIMGLTHPFTGLDHMAAMITVGVWSMLAFRHSPRAALTAPAAFACLLLVGGLLGFAGIAFGGVEPMIAASLLVLGLMVALRVKLPAAVGALIVGAFAIFHGIAHGAELPAERAAAALSGMVLGTLILHVSGMTLARFGLERNVWLPRIAGAGVALFGLSLLTA